MADTIIGRIRAVITGDSSGLTVATDKAERSLKDLGKTAQKTSSQTSSAMSSMAGTIGTAFATAKVLQFAKSSVLAAGDIAEAVNATRVIFGSASATIEEFASTASKTLGQSEKQALDASNTFATFGKSAGLTGNQLSDFAMKMVGLSSDLASFRNTTPEDAIMAVGAALRGETEPIRRYGILLNDMTLRQEALRLGLVKTTSEALSPQAKVLAAQAAIWKQSTDAQGDFARTSDSLSNQIKIVNAQFADLKARVGEAFVPMAQGALQVLNPLIKAFNALDGGTQKAIGQFVMLNTVLVLVKRTLVGFGVEAKRMTAAMVGVNAAFIAVYAIGKIFQAGVEGNTAEVKDFTAALKENDSALRANALAKLAQEDPQVREYLNTIGELGITINDLSRYYQDLGGPAAEIRNRLAEIANSGGTLRDRLALLNKEFQLGINVQSLTDDQIAKTYSKYQNLQFLLFNVEQEWRNNTLATDAFASALSGVPTTADEASTALNYTAESFDAYRDAILGVANATKRQLTVASNDAIESTNDFIEKMKEGRLSNGEFTNALIEQADRLLQLQFATKGEIGALKQVAPTMRFVIESLYAAGAAQGYTRAETSKLINELHLLDGVDPQIKIFMAMDLEELRAQAAQIRKQIESLRMDSFSRSSPLTRDLIDQLEMIAQLGDAVSGVGDFKPSGGGGGGGGGNKPFEWVEDWLKDIADFTAQIADEDFANQLISSSADDIAKAFRDLIEEAGQRGISLLDGGYAVGLMAKVSEQLQAAANQLGGAGGLQERFAAATDRVRDFQQALDDLKDRFKEFMLVERGVGKYTAVELLDQGLAKLEDLKAQLAAAEQAYADFQSGGVSALDQQRQALEGLGTQLENLRTGLAKVNQEISGENAVSPLEREIAELDRLRSALAETQRARTEYSKNLTEQLSTIQYAERGGALLNAQRYLQKVSAFRDIIAGLRDRAFPQAIIRDVLNAGLEGGTKLGRKLLSLSDADLTELKKVQAQISNVAAETGEIAAAVLFDADISAADSAFRQQLALVQGLYQQAITTVQQQYDTQKTIVEGIYKEQIAQAKAALEQQRVVVEALFKTALSEAKKHLKEASDEADILKSSIDDLTDMMKDLIQQIADAVKAASTQPSSSSPSSGGGGGWTGRPTPDGGAIFDRPGSNPVYLPPGLDFSGFKAMGGSVQANKAYVVGERGAELFVPNSNGTVLPNGFSMGGGTYNITVNANGNGSGADIGRQVVKAIQEYERRNGAGWRA